MLSRVLDVFGGASSVPTIFRASQVVYLSCQLPFPLRNLALLLLSGWRTCLVKTPEMAHRP